MSEIPMYPDEYLARGEAPVQVDESIITALLDHNADLTTRLAESQRALNVKTHECEALREQLGVAVAIRKREPGIVVDCVHEGCINVLTRDVAPPEDTVPQWLRGLDWGYTEDGGAYLYPEHRRRP